jgi:sugar transferase (PEP-CTERM/EpsH1 system associated)
VKPALLLLCHRIPYPPNKGDKIRAYHLLKFLAEHYDVHLGSFIDDPLDWKYISDVDAICKSTHFVKLDPLQAKIKCLKGFFSGQALSVPYYNSKSLENWVGTAVKTHNIKKAMVVSSVMAQFLANPALQLDRKIIDIVDIDSDKWMQYSAMKTWPMSWVYQREARTLLEYEKEAVNCFDTSFFVSSAEAEMFKSKVGDLQDKVSFYNNGVDNDYFSLSGNLPNPYSLTKKPIVFTGAMDYWPNIDAVKWFVKEVFPTLYRNNPALTFYIVGSNPSDDVLQLAKIDGVVVTGRVEDIRPYIEYSYICVAPMRVARGIQNKVLEAMAMEKAVVVSTMGLEGINAKDGLEVLVADSAEDFINTISKMQESKIDRIGTAARMRVKKDFNWSQSLPVVLEHLEKNLQRSSL